MQQICGNCKMDTNFLMNGLCGECMGLGQPDGIPESGLTEPLPGPIEIYNAFRAIEPETFPGINADGTRVGVFDSGLAEGQTEETAQSPIINKYWAIDYARLGAFEAEVGRLVGLHKHELAELLALESAMISTISYAMVDARLRYGMLVRSVERSNGRTELSI